MNLGPRGFRFFVNLYPPYLFSRTRVKYIASDWKEMIVELSKSILTRNYVGTTFGGSLYSAADPFFMLMLAKIFGLKDYIIWDKGAQVEFKRPARSKITYRFLITDKALQKIHQDLNDQGKSLPDFQVDGIDKDGEICVSVKKSLYLRKK
jgi:hypothetical protein